jgi:hypothetical protein
MFMGTSDNVQIATIVVTGLGTAFTLLMAYLMAKLNHKQDVTSTQVREASSQITDIAKVAESTHTLVNSNMGIQLELNMAVTGRLAAITKDPMDIEAAKLAKDNYLSHQMKQSIVDSSSGKKPVKP